MSVRHSIIVAAIGFVLASSLARGSTQIFLETADWYMYPHQESLSIVSITPLSSGIGPHIVLGSVSTNLANYPFQIRCYVNGVSSSTTSSQLQAGNAPNSGSADIDFTAYRMSTLPVSCALGLTVAATSYSIWFEYASPALYAAYGMSSPGVVVLQQTNMLFMPSQVSSWITDAPTAADIGFAQQTWGNLITPSATPTENAQSIAKAIIKSLEGHRGIPSNAMNSASPFDQYRMAISGQGQVWCTNLLRSTRTL